MHTNKIRVWSLPTRLFHWLLVTSFALCWWWQDDQHLYFHLLAGYLFFGLLLFRLVWGFVGEPHARFRDFVHGTGEVMNYLKSLCSGRPQHHLGHNPAGGWAIVALIGCGLLVGLTGIVTLGAEERHGPLAGVLGFQEGMFFHILHEGFSWIMLALVIMHLLGVLIESRLHHENLTLAMVTGKKVADRPERPAPAHAIVGLGLVTAVAGFSGWWLKDYFNQTPDEPHRPFRGTELAKDPLWQEECGGCHLAYHPSLLPARSWERIFSTQADHFGEDLALDETTIARLLAFAVAHAAESQPTEAAWKILISIPAQQTPRRITATPYWLRKHEEIADWVWRMPKVNGAFNCDACHLDAHEGWFEDDAMGIPTPDEGERP